MNAKQHFKKHYAKICLEAWVLSLLSALCIGFCVGFATALALWLMNAKHMVLITVAVLLGITAVVTPLFYLFKYRPTAKGNARRIDRLGLEERLITMVELEKEESYIAQLQRQDAKKALEKISTSQICIRVPRKMSCTLIVTGVLCILMTTVGILSAAGLLPSGQELLETLIPDDPIQYVSISYEVEDGGSIEGDPDQLIPIGSSSTEIIAVADDGWEFVEWDDGYDKPARSDKNITEDTVYIAIFMPIDSEGDPDESAEDGEESDDAQDKPQDSDQSGGQTGDDSTDSPSNVGGGKYEECNQIIDGETYYREVLELYRELLAERLSQEGDQFSEEAIEIIKTYLGIV